MRSYARCALAASHRSYSTGSEHVPVDGDAVTTAISPPWRMMIRGSSAFAVRKSSLKRWVE
jgi:hypothetical protein